MWYSGYNMLWDFVVKMEVVAGNSNYETFLHCNGKKIKIWNIQVSQYYIGCEHFLYVCWYPSLW